MANVDGLVPTPSAFGILHYFCVANRCKNRSTTNMAAVYAPPTRLCLSSGRHKGHLKEGRRRPPGEHPLGVAVAILGAIDVVLGGRSTLLGDPGGGIDEEPVHVEHISVPDWPINTKHPKPPDTPQELRDLLVGI